MLPLSAIRHFVADKIEAVVSAMPGAVLGATTGTTPLKTGIYEELVARARVGKIDFSNVYIVSTDEFLGIPQEHPETYYSYMKKHLLNHVRFNPQRWIIPNSSSSDANAECDRIEKLITAAGHADFQLLGVGMNGHLCFIEPAEALPATCFVTPIAETNRALYASDFGGDGASVPTHAITYGLGTLLQARELCLVAVGKAKAELVRRALCGPVSTLFPASFLQLHPRVCVVLDEEAAAALPAGFAVRRPVA